MSAKGRGAKEMLQGMVCPEEPAPTTLCCRGLCEYGKTTCGAAFWATESAMQGNLQPAACEERQKSLAAATHCWRPSACRQRSAATPGSGGR